MLKYVPDVISWIVKMMINRIMDPKRKKEAIFSSLMALLRTKGTLITPIIRI